MSLEEDILNRIRPNAEEHKRALGVVESIQNTIKNLEVSKSHQVELMLVGSVAKETFLSAPDLDIFVLFDPSVPREELIKAGLEIGHSVVPNGEERYAEHPYINGSVDGFEVDIVPCYKVDDPSQKISSVDRTPFHTRYIIDTLKEEQRDDVLLLKQFLKGIGVYGAEARIKGFSGYLCELLIIYYGSFGGTLEAASQWRSENTYLYLTENKGTVKIKEPLIVIDPIDDARNVASAVSEESMALFSLAAKEYIKEPREIFFFPHPAPQLSRDELAAHVLRSKYHLVSIEVNHPGSVDDVLYPILGSTVDEKDGVLYFIFSFSTSERPAVKRHRGPPLWHPNSEAFLSKWSQGSGKDSTVSQPYLDGSHWAVLLKEDNTEVLSFIQASISSWNVGKELNGLVPDAVYSSGEDVLERVPSMFLTSFILKKFPWEY